MRKSYYRVEADITPGWKIDRAAWVVPPHVALANLGYDHKRQAGGVSDKDIETFTRAYGPLDAPDPLEGGASPFRPTLVTHRHLQTAVRAAWKLRDFRAFNDAVTFGEHPGYDWLPMGWGVRGKRLEMRPAGLYWYIAILLARDIAEGRARFCQNPQCPHPYFIARRVDATFCSRLCAVAVNVARFRKRQKRSKR